MPSEEHKKLVEKGATWLRRKCSVVATELTSSAFQSPDVIGFTSNCSYLIEVKVSRDDFFADRKKPQMKSAENMPAAFRWYLTPPDLVAVDELPFGWGLLELHGKSVRVIRGTIDDPGGAYRNGRWERKVPPEGMAHCFQEINHRAERAMLFSIARRSQQPR